MAIYKLKDLYSKKPQYGASLAAQETGEYRYVRQADISTKVFNTFVDSGPLLYEGDILISRVGAYAGKTYIHDSRKNHVFAGFLVRYKFDEKKLMNKYFYYWTKTNIYIDQMMKLRTGVAQPNFNPGSVGELKIDLPSIEQQKKIIDIIEPYKELFFKYGNLFELDSILNVKKGIKTLIDIIEPLENAENTIDYLDELIVNVEDILICKIDNAEKIINTRDNFIKIKSQKKKSEELIPVSIGYAGFGKKHGKVAKQSKVVNQYDFAIGLISKRIPIAYNFSDKELGISTAYYCFESKIPIINFYFYKHLTNDWEQYVKRTSRQGQGFEKDIYLNEKILLPRIESFMEYQNIFNLLVNLKLKVKKMKIKEIKEKVIKGLL